MNKYPAWKYLVLIVVVAVGMVYALPNIYGDDPAVQISPRAGVSDDAIEQTVTTALETLNVNPISIENNAGKLLLRFANTSDQLKANSHLAETLGNRYLMAQNLAPATPQWLRQFAQPMFLGLDLRGGVHFLMQMDMDSAIKQAKVRYADDLRATMKDKKIRYRSVRYTNNQLEVRFKTAALRDSTLEVLQADYPDLLFTPAMGKALFYCRKLNRGRRRNRTHHNLAAKRGHPAQPR